MNFLKYALFAIFAGLFLGSMVKVDAMEVSVHRDITGGKYSVLMYGTVDFGDEKKLADASNGKHISKIFVRSYGGYVDAGLKTAKMIRKMNVPVIAFQWCQSACTFLLSAGSEKYIASGTKVGFHCPYYTMFGFLFQLKSGGITWFKIYNTFKSGFHGDAEMAALWVSTTYGTPSREMFIVSDHNASLYGIEVL